MIVNRKHDWELHCHSLYSDGALHPKDLYALAVESGIEHLALTDHDTTAGYRESLTQKWVPESLTLYPATELSCIWKARTIHIVGLGIDAFSERWLAIEQDYNERRERRFLRILYLLEKGGFTMDEAEIRKIAHPGPPARPHVATYLAESEQIKTTAHAYKKWLGQGKPGDVKQQWPELAEAVENITQCGGVAVIAHPHRYKLTWTKTRELLDDFTEAGGQAVEVACIGMHPDQRKFLLNQVEQRNMLVSGGSDFHNPTTPWLKLGTYPEWSAHHPSVREWLLNQSAS